MPIDLRRRRRSNEGVCEMGPRRSRLYEYAAYPVGNCPSACPPVNQLSSNLRYLPNNLSHRQVNHKSCTTCAANSCFVLAELALRNDFLWANFKHRQVSPGWPALAGLRGRVAPKMQRRHSFVLVHWLLMKHHCIQFVVLREPRISHNHFRFRGRRRRSRHLGHVKLRHYLLDDRQRRDFIDALRSTLTTLDTLERERLGQSQHAHAVRAVRQVRSPAPGHRRGPKHGRLHED
ncbi:hypothetical protein HPB49_026589 [Dermacentor silvarum]|nr:hypothetical protein HPB49_026589 [Dermacentor silvarum]